MNIYSRKQKWKLFLLTLAVFIGMSSLYYTNTLVGKLAAEERKSVELWAKATRELSRSNLDENINFISEVIINNTTIPVILTNEAFEIQYARNLDPKRSQTDSALLSPEKYQLNQEYLYRELDQMRSQNEPIEITMIDGRKNYIFYKDSMILRQLIYYPYVQLAVIFLFVLIAYYAFSTSRKAEQNQVWLGMSKETAHQLGTPISSLLAWIEYLKLKNPEDDMVQEIQKDVSRLETITERFSKIGSTPVLASENIVHILYQSIRYLKTRTSSNIEYHLHFAESMERFIPLNKALFEWVVENICKNAMDAMEGKGRIDLRLEDTDDFLCIDISDSGKGLHKTLHKTIFNPGFTTKKRGWGLGLSLSKRIVENYHGGKIFVKSSSPGEGTTFRIMLRKEAGLQA